MTRYGDFKKMMLADVDIRESIERGDIRINPYNPDSIGPCSIDLRLDSMFRLYNPGPAVDIKSSDSVETNTSLIDTEGKPFMILPGQFVLGQTIERISISRSYAGLLEGKSSVARLGIIVHAAGLVNPGTGTKKPGRLTLEIFCENLSPVMLYPGMGIVQMMLIRLSRASESGYDERSESMYVGQDIPEVR